MNKVRIPFSIVLVLIGFIGSELTVKLFSIDTGLRWHNFKDIIYYVILPIVIFQSAIEINLKSLLRNLIPILILSLPLMIVSTVVTALGLFSGIDHVAGFPWIAALIAGALLSATDPASVLIQLKNSNVPERLCVILEGESLFNDATAIVLFSILISIATSQQVSTSSVMLLTRFFEVFVGGLFIGLIVGLIVAFIIKKQNSQQSYLLISIFTTYLIFIIVETVLSYSGVIATLVFAMTVGNKCKDLHKDNSFASQGWQLLSKQANSIVFLMAGVSITLTMFIDQWLAILIGIIAVLFSRIVVIFGAFPFLSVLPGIVALPLKQQTVLVWGGVRGTVTLALALSLPLTLDYWYTIQSIAYGVVLFTLFVQVLTLPLILNRFEA